MAKGVQKRETGDRRSEERDIRRDHRPWRKRFQREKKGDQRKRRDLTLKGSEEEKGPYLEGFIGHGECASKERNRRSGEEKGS